MLIGFVGKEISGEEGGSSLIPSSVIVGWWGVALSFAHMVEKSGEWLLLAVCCA